MSGRGVASRDAAHGFSRIIAPHRISWFWLLAEFATEPKINEKNNVDDNGEIYSKRASYHLKKPRR
jgi:hypothetical protein